MNPVPVVPIEVRPAPLRVAVLLNRRARGVRPRQIERIARLHPTSDIFLSEDLEHCRAIARVLVQRCYDRVLLGGGDGTFTRCLTELEREARRQGAPLPTLGVLRLGTGNALGLYLGASEPSERGLRADLLRAHTLGVGPTRGAPGSGGGLVKPLQVLRVAGQLATFAGTGLDSQILQDYGATGRMLDNVGVGPFFSSPLRYALAVALRSLPRFLFRRLPQVEVRNVGGPAYQIGPDGQPESTPLPAGTVLYRGPCTLAGAATIPCYGFNVRIFPYADRLHGKFHLRCTDASALETLAHLPAVLRGEYRSPSIRDFLCDAVELHTDQPVPFQVGGDLLPDPGQTLRIELNEHIIPVLSA